MQVFCHEVSGGDSTKEFSLNLETAVYAVLNMTNMTGRVWRSTFGDSLCVQKFLSSDINLTMQFSLNVSTI